LLLRLFWDLNRKLKVLWNTKSENEKIRKFQNSIIYIKIVKTDYDLKYSIIKPFLMICLTFKFNSNKGQKFWLQNIQENFKIMYSLEPITDLWKDFKKRRKQIQLLTWENDDRKKQKNIITISTNNKFFWSKIWLPLLSLA